MCIHAMADSDDEGGTDRRNPRTQRTDVDMELGSGTDISETGEEAQQQLGPPLLQVQLATAQVKVQARLAGHLALQVQLSTQVAAVAALELLQVQLSTQVAVAALELQFAAAESHSPCSPSAFGVRCHCCEYC